MTSFEATFREYMDVYDGTKKGFSAVADLFERVVHDDLQMQIGDKVLNKEAFQDMATALLSAGSKCDLTSFHYLEDGQVVEYAIRVTNEDLDAEGRSRATIKDGKLWKVCPAPSADKNAYEKLIPYSQKQFDLLESNIREYFATYDGTKKEFSAMEDVFDRLFHDDLEIDMGNGKVHTKADHQKSVANLLAGSTKCTFESIQRIGNDKVEYTLHVQNSKLDMDAHSIATIKEGKIWRVQPAPSLEKEAYGKMLGSSNA